MQPFETLHIVDAVNILFRAYYAIGPMSSPSGKPTGALYGFIRSIYKLIQDFSPNYFVAVFDGPDNKRSRTIVYQDYKSHRKGMPEDLVSQLHDALYFCEIAGIPLLSIEGVEADDTIGSITHWMESQRKQTVIFSSDKDLCQLVTDNTHVVNPQKANLRIDPQKVEELFGVHPRQIVDLLAMMGDASDNIPGLEGIGSKTAAKLLQQFDSLEAILKHPEKLSGKKHQELFQTGKDVVLMSQKLAQIDTSVIVPHDPLFFHLKTPDLEKLTTFYQERHFLSLLRDLKPAETKTQTHYHLIDEEKELLSLIERLQKETLVCIDTETTSPHPMQAELVGIGVGIQAAEAWYIPLYGKLGKEKVLAALKPLIENQKIGWIGHNIKYDYHVLNRENLRMGHIAFDTIVASHLLSAHTQQHNLDSLCLEKFQKVKIPIDQLIGKGKHQITMKEVPINEVCAYCCEDVDYTLRLHTLFSQELQDRGLLPLFEEIEIPLIPILAKMEETGIYLDKGRLKEMSIELSEQIILLEQQIYQFAGEEFNINSPKQLSTILFEKLGIKPIKKTTTGYSTAADVLEALQHEAPIVKLILEYRTLSKLLSTYIDALPQEVLPATQRIHCTFNQSVTATGRLSCQQPNLQNIPIRSEEGKKIRSAFRPQFPNYSFLSADYSQIELRLLAHFSEDPILLSAFLNGEDIHAHTASVVFNIPLKNVTPEMRHRAKAVNFGILYGQQAYGLSEQLGIDYKEAQKFIDTYFTRYSKVKDFLHSSVTEARKTGYAVTLTGRQRLIPDIDSTNAFLRSQAERLAINTPLQGTAADLIKIAMIHVDALLEKNSSLGKLLLQIHDELLFEVPDSQCTLLAKEVKKIMENAFSLKVPLIVDISIGKNWGAC